MQSNHTDFLSAREIAHVLHGRRVGSGYVCRCPSHQDRNPSLSLRDSDNGPLVHCHAGCDQRSVIAALRDLGLWPERERRWLSDAEFREELRRRRERYERERQAAYFCLALEPLLLELIDALPDVETIDWDDDDAERLALTRELAMVRAARDNPVNQAVLYGEWLNFAPKLADAIYYAGVERQKRLQTRTWGWISAQR